MVQVDTDISCSLHNWNSSILWERFGPDCIKELGKIAITYGDQVVLLRVSGSRFSNLCNTIQIVVQSCPNLETLWLDNVSFQEGDLMAIHQSMAVKKLHIGGCKFELNGKTWALELDPRNMRFEMCATC
jgi:hypothetical protein